MPAPDSIDGLSLVSFFATICVILNGISLLLAALAAAMWFKRSSLTQLGYSFALMAFYVSLFTLISFPLWLWLSDAPHVWLATLLCLPTVLITLVFFLLWNQRTKDHG